MSEIIQPANNKKPISEKKLAHLRNLANVRREVYAAGKEAMKLKSLNPEKSSPEIKEDEIIVKREEHRKQDSNLLTYLIIGTAITTAAYITVTALAKETKQTKPKTAPKQIVQQNPTLPNNIKPAPYSFGKF